LSLPDNEKVNRDQRTPQGLPANQKRFWQHGTMAL
jgi:hypothetical protein